jgi:hypothetical protein
MPYRFVYVLAFGCASPGGLERGGLADEEHELGTHDSGRNASRIRHEWSDISRPAATAAAGSPSSADEGMPSEEEDQAATASFKTPKQELEPEAMPSAPDEITSDENVESPEQNGIVTEALRPPSWEEFKRQATRNGPGGSIYYIVEWDIPIQTEDDLHTYYDEMVSGYEDKGVLHLLASGADDVWAGDDELHLRYCVDTDTTTGFGAPSSGVTAATMIAAMQAATAAWHQAANVSFQYDSGNNNNCGITSPIPDSQYIKLARADAIPGFNGLCAFGPISKAAWTCVGLDGATIGVPSTFNFATQGFSGWTWAGAVTHEVGHVLGLHHEQFHTNGGGCMATGVRNISATADTVSIMGYPATAAACSNITPTGTTLSAGDGTAVRSLYGMPAAWYVPLFNDT